MGDPAGFVASAEVAERIAELADDYVALAAERSGQLPTTDFDADWPSPCVTEMVDADRCWWQPVAMQRALPFERLTDALGVPVHSSISTFFNVNWSASIPVTFNDNDLALLQLWNEEEFENLLGNFIGHSLEKKRVSQPLSLFFALVDDDRLLTVDNQSGSVLLETLGQRKPLDVAPSLQHFLASVDVRWPSDAPPES